MILANSPKGESAVHHSVTPIVMNGWVHVLVSVLKGKRSKRVELTALGKQVATDCSGRIGKNAKMLMARLDEEDKALCIQILKDVEIKLSASWPKHRSKEFQEINDELMGGAFPASPIQPA